MKKAFIFYSFALFFIMSATGQNNWTVSTTYHSRVLNCVKVMDYNNICIVGGNRTNDSIQTIHVSHDAGTNWTTVSDNIKPWLRSCFFPSSGNAIAVGDYGTIIKTINGGDSWSPVSAPTGLTSVHFSSVYFTNYLNGFIAGGNAQLGMTTLLKTTDGGSNWSILINESGQVLNSIHFSDQANGWTVGNEGIVYKTNNGGDTWQQISLPGAMGDRNMMSVFFINNQTGFIAGGEETDDSLQTLLKTTDGGNSWQVVIDNPGNQLNAVYFINENFGFAAGNYGTLLQTEDAGMTWTEVILPQNDYSKHFKSIHFMNLDYGYVTGTGGICYRYHNSQGHTPTAITLTPTDQSFGSVTLNGLVNANGYPTDIVFEYGTSTSYSNTIQPGVSVVSGNLNHSVKAVLNGLNPNTLYHFRMKATNYMGTTVGVDDQFYTGNSGIPNFNFESWDSSSVMFPAGYSHIGGNCVRTENSCHGNYAIILSNDSSSLTSAGMLMGVSEDGMTFTGGKPFNGRPDSLRGCFDYQIAAGDSALLILIFKNNSQIISLNTYYISGSSGNSYEEKSFLIDYLSGESPDTVIFGISITSFLGTDTVIIGNYLAVDYLRFDGITDTLFNYDFENWPEYSIKRLNQWDYEKKDEPIEPLFINQFPVLQSQLYHDGLFSAQLRHMITSKDTSEAYMQSDAFSIGYIPKKLTGFYHYQNPDGDTLSISVALFSQGQLIGYANFKTTESTEWFTPFEVEINYNQTVMCDSASIRVSIVSDQVLSQLPFALIDDLNFDSFLLRVDEQQAFKPSCFNDLLVFPNPARNSAFIHFNSDLTNETEIMLCDISGRCITREVRTITPGKNELQLLIPEIENGLYLIVMRSNGVVVQKKIIVQKNM